jgi:hypothetical protein
VLEALKILRGDDLLVAGRYTLVSRRTMTSRNALLLATKLQKPNKE